MKTRLAFTKIFTTCMMFRKACITAFIGGHDSRSACRHIHRLTESSYRVYASCRLAAYQGFWIAVFGSSTVACLSICFVLAQKRMNPRGRISPSPLVLLTMIFFHVPIVPTELLAQSLRLAHVKNYATSLVEQVNPALFSLCNALWSRCESIWHHSSTSAFSPLVMIKA